MLDPYAPPSVELDAAPLEDSGVVELADRGTRLGAAILDGLLYAIAAAPALLLGRAVYGVPLVALALCQWYLIASRGQSIAKGWLHIRIVRMDGSPCGFVRGVLLRIWILAAVAGGALVAVVANGIDGLFMFGAERRCIHDLIAGTKVVRV